MLSWGFIEVIGYTPAIAAADAMIKSADVKIAGIEVIGGGFVTVGVTGEVGAIRTAIDAGVSAAQQIGTVHCSKVLARPAADAAKIVSFKLAE